MHGDNDYDERKEILRILEELKDQIPVDVDKQKEIRRRIYYLNKGVRIYRPVNIESNL